MPDTVLGIGDNCALSSTGTKPEKSHGFYILVATHLKNYIQSKTCKWHVNDT